MKDCFPGLNYLTMTPQLLPAAL